MILFNKIKNIFKKCPSCGSKRVHRIGNGRWQCSDCGWTFS